jgi:flavin-dependent dehydrogenase
VGTRNEGHVQSYDVAIVGGGPAGLSTALFLASAAPHLTERILVLEKAHYPREKYCAGGIGVRGDRLLETIGVRIDVPSVAVTTLSMQTAFGVSIARVPCLGRVVRRIEFDHALALAARARGIRVLEGARVDRLHKTSRGYELESSGGAIHARVLVGADGVTGVTRRALGLSASKYRAQVVELDTEPVASDLARTTLHFDHFDPGFTGYAWDFPTLVDGKPLMCRGVYHLRLPGQNADIQDVLGRRLRERGLDIEQYRLKRFAEVGFEPHRSYAEPHALLVGEAAGIDAFSGEGIAQAIDYGAFAATYLSEKLAINDLSFSDWRKRFARSSVGLDLAIREWWMNIYFGPHRVSIERYLASHPMYARCTADQLAGAQNTANWHFLQALLGAGKHALTAEAGKVLRALSRPDAAIGGERTFPRERT